MAAVLWYCRAEELGVNRGVKDEVEECLLRLRWRGRVCGAQRVFSGCCGCKSLLPVLVVVLEPWVLRLQVQRERQMLRLLLIRGG